MASGKEIQLYSDIGKSQPVYPKTNAKCVFYDDGTRLDRMIAAARPRNLLINSDFTNPVNQRGQAKYNGYGYTIDRWMITGNDHSDSVYVTVEDGQVRFWNGSSIVTGLEQRFPYGVLDQNKVYTLAWLDYYGNITVKQAPIVHYADYGFSAVYVYMMPDETLLLKWAALYEGEYTLETLPKYQPNGYENELLACRQYDPVTGEYIGLRKFGQPHNLLDNSDFRNPVNQLGVSFVNTRSSYPVDNWRFDFDSANTTANANFDTTNRYLYMTRSNSAGFYGLDQSINGNIKNKTFTVAVDCNSYGATFDIAILTESWTRIVRTTMPAVNGRCCMTFNSGNNDFIRVVFYPNSNEFIIRNAALYEGIYSIHTLPEYQPKGKQVEALNCGIVPFAPDLLWQNASVVSQFDPQTIALDLSTYAWLILEWAFSTDNDNRYTMLIPTRDASKHEMHINATSQNRDGGRLVSVDGNNVVFEAGKYNTSTNNKNVIPTRIWGLKEATA